MSFLAGRPWLRRFGLALVTVLGLGGAMTAGSSPADARVWVSFGVPFPGFYAPPPPAYYYAPPAYPVYYRPYRHHRHWCYWHPYRCGGYW